MAEGTRLKGLNEHLKVVEERVQNLTLDCNQVLESKFHQFELEYNRKLGIVAQQLDDMQKEGQQRYEAQQMEAVRRHEQLLKMFSNQSSVINTPSHSSSPLKETKPAYDYYGHSSTRTTVRDDEGKGILPNPQVGHDGIHSGIGQRNQYYIPRPKLDYPTFGGEEPREWISKSEQYFRLYQIPEEQWVEVATLHFSGRAHRWKEGYLLDKPNISWEELTEATCRRFDGATMKKLMREFNKLVHNSSVEKYQKKFEELRIRMIHLNPTLSEEHFIQSYISGLKEKLVPFIDLSNPHTLEEVYEQAKLHEQALAMLWRRPRVFNKPTGNNQNQSYSYSKPFTQKLGYGQMNNSKWNANKNSEGPYGFNRQVFEQRRTAGLCYKCNTPIVPHRMEKEF